MAVWSVDRMMARPIRSRMELFQGLKKKSLSNKCLFPSSLRSRIHWLTFVPSASRMESGWILPVALAIDFPHRSLPSSQSLASSRSNLVGTRCGGVNGLLGWWSSSGPVLEGGSSWTYLAMLHRRCGFEVDCDCGRCGAAAMGLLTGVVF